jgi:hypothetical protein
MTLDLETGGTGATTYNFTELRWTTSRAMVMQAGGGQLPFGGEATTTSGADRQRAQLRRGVSLGVDRRASMVGPGIFAGSWNESKWPKDRVAALEPQPPPAIHVHDAGDGDADHDPRAGLDR